ncbi:uncharacterized protein LOC119874292 isoform X4 [Canis lupus familiaris]|uniref:uncharacterized protein LOC119874292 isoform X4 n=1 Tax=Canis lupus familiaris TaxID=9615 RepID=UPI0018F7AC92|nr:uncharacterized protein LOC119874292 isoform X4 [Canis lupus familiaris]
MCGIRDYHPRLQRHCEQRGGNARGGAQGRPRSNLQSSGRGGQSRQVPTLQAQGGPCPAHPGAPPLGAPRTYTPSGTPTPASASSPSGTGEIPATARPRSRGAGPRRSPPPGLRSRGLRGNRRHSAARPGDRWISRGLDPEKRVLLQRARSGCLVNTQSRAVASRGRAGAGNSFVRIEDAYCSRSVDEAWAERRRSQCRGALTDTLCVGSSCRAQTGLSHLPGRSETDHCVLNEHLRCPWRVHPCGIQFISNLSGSIRGGFDSLCPGPVHKMCAAAHKVASHECHRNRVEGNTREKGFFPTQNFTCAKNYTDSHEDIPAVSVLPSVEENEIPSEVYNVIDSEEGLRDPLVFNDPYWPMQWELVLLLHNFQGKF